MKTAFTTFLLAFFSLFLNNTYAQKDCQCDYAEKIKPQIGYYYNTGNLDSAKILINSIKKKGTKICDILYHNGMSQVAIAENDLVSARKHLDSEFKLLKKIDCPERLSKHYSNYSTLYNFLNKQDSAVHISLLGLDAATEAGDTLTMIRLCGNIASFFDQMGQFKQTIKYEEKAYQLATKYNDPYSKAMAYTQISGSYLTLYEDTKDRSYLDKALKTAYVGLNNAYLVQQLPLALDAYNVISKAYGFTKDHQLSIQYADSILINAPKGVDLFYRNLQEAYLRKSQAYMSRGNYLLAKQNADSSVFYGRLFNDLVTLGPLELVYQSSKKLGDNASALAAYEEMTHLKDSLFNLEKNGRISELEKKYNQAKNERTIKEFQQEDEIKSLRIRVLVILILIAIVVLVLILLIFRQKNLKQNQLIMETEQRLNRSRMNPHFFFNALTTLQGLAVRENDGKKMAINLFKFSSLMRKTLESSYNDYVSISKELEFIHQYIELQLLKDNERFSFNVSLNSDVEADDVMIPSMLIQPFLENAIEHGFSTISYKGELSLRFELQGEQLLISIEDNGSGISTSINNKDHISRATQITKDRLYLLQREKKVNALFDVKRNVDGGVLIEILLPLIYS